MKLKPGMILITLILLSSMAFIAIPEAANAQTVKTIYAGYMISYALADDGSLWVWGNFGGQNYVHPVLVQTLDHVSMVAPGNILPIVLKDDGTVWSLGNVLDKIEITQIDISDVKYVACAGSAYYAIKEDGSLWAWGDNRNGEVGNPDITDETVPYPVKVPLDKVGHVVPKSGFTFAQTEDGSWWGWGDNSEYELNDGTNEKRHAPVHLNIDSDTIIASGDTKNVLVLKKDGTVWTWGDNTGGQAGDPRVPNCEITNNKVVIVPIKSPLQVSGLSNVIAIGSSTSSCVVLKDDGTVWTWGNDHTTYNANLGNLDSDKPIQVPGLSEIVAIIPGAGHFFAVKSDGTVWAWGYNYAGQLGDGQILNNLGGSCGMPVGVRVTDLFVDMPYGSGKAATTPIATATPSPLPAPTSTQVVASAPPVENPITSKSTDTIRPCPTPVPLPSVTPESTSGFSFKTMAMLGCLFITASLLSGVVRRNDR